jgi:ssDNA-binding Zn-finger/Zn-ribbon topoisomerase 1
MTGLSDPSADRRCPQCHTGTLCERKNRTTGQRFWGCDRYPDCKFAVRSPDRMKPTTVNGSTNDAACGELAAAIRELASAIRELRQLAKPMASNSDRSEGGAL